MNLRELINKLEELSENGKNDNLRVETFDCEFGETFEGEDISFPIRDVQINNYLTQNGVRDYIQIRF